MHTIDGIDVLPFSVVGDVHGSLNHLQYALVNTLRQGLTNIIQVGDYWCYDGRNLEKVDRLFDIHAKQRGLDEGSIRLWFCDGNHEDFRILDPNADAPVQISKYVTYVPRGIATEIAGVNIGFLGGAESIDKEYRVEGKSWFREETMTYSQIDRALDMEDIEVLVTHDTTVGVYEALYAARHGHAMEKMDFGANERRALTAVVEKLSPTWMVHGHHHVSAVNDEGSTRVVSLSNDGRKGNIGFLGVDGKTVLLTKSRVAWKDDDILINISDDDVSMME